LLVFRDKIVHVGFSFSEFHFIHTLTSVPVQESLTTEHGSELFRDTFPYFLNSSGVANECGGHLQSLWWDVANGCLDVVGDPFNEVRRVLVDDVEHLFIDFLGGHSSTEHASASEVASVTRIGSAHHVLGIELLLSQLRHGQSTVLLRSTRCQRSKSHHEKVKTRERNHVDGKFAQVAVQLTRETQAAGSSANSSRDQVVQVTISRSGEFEGAEANVIKCLVIKGKALIGVFHKLVNRQGGVVWFHDSVRHLGGRNNGVCGHDTIRIFFTDLGDQESTHTRSRATTHGVSELKSLEAVARFGFLADHIEHRVDEFSTFGVVTLGPVVSSTD